MLAIFDKSVARRPDTLKKKPHHKSLTARKNGFLVNHFLSLHPVSVVTEVGDSAVFAYSLVEEVDEARRFQFVVEGDTFCLYQGEMDNVADLLKKYSLPTATVGVDVDVDDVRIVIRALKILQEHTYLTLEHILNDIHGDFSVVFFDSSTELLFLTTGIPTGAPLYWGIDSESSLILSDDKNVVKEACASTIQPFPDDEVYISRRGNVGLEAIFHDYTAEDVEQQAVETKAKHVTGMTTTNGHTIELQIKSWQPPPSPEVYKINTHGIFFHQEKMVGIGVVIRNSRGQMILGGSKNIKGFNSQIHAHQMASMDGLTLALKAGLKKVIWESVNCLDKDSRSHLVQRHNIIPLARKFSSFKFSEIPLKANKAAYGLAEHAKEVDDYVVWVREVPECIASVIEMESSSGLLEPGNGSLPIQNGY